MKNLTDIIYQYKNSEFNLGQFDCCIFTALVVEEYTNKKLPYWRESVIYNDVESSLKALKSEFNIKKLKDLPEKILGSPRLPISEVKLGYPVYYINEENEGILGICNGAQAYFLGKGGGLTTRKIEDCLYCWSID